MIRMNARDRIASGGFTSSLLLLFWATISIKVLDTYPICNLFLAASLSV